jgi:spermidine/putrescine transport system permease protein
VTETQQTMAVEGASTAASGEKRGGGWLFTPAFLWLTALVVAPLLIIVVVSLASRGSYGRIVYRLTIENYVRALDVVYLPAYWRSIWIGLATTGLSALIGYPVAYYIALKAPARWKRILLVLAVVPFWTSFLIRTYAWMLLLRSEGLVNTTLMGMGVIDGPLRLLYNDFAIMVGQVYGELPFMILPIYVVLERLDVRLLEAAQDLGASRLWTFLKVTLPLSRPGVMAGVVLVFIPSLGAFITPDLLGGAKSIMIGNLIQNQFSLLNQPFGSALSLMLAAAVLVLLAIAVRAGLKSGEIAG